MASSEAAPDRNRGWALLGPLTRPRAVLGLPRPHEAGDKEDAGMKCHVVLCMQLSSVQGHREVSLAAAPRRQRTLGVLRGHAPSLEYALPCTRARDIRAGSS